MERALARVRAFESNWLAWHMTGTIGVRHTRTRGSPLSSSSSSLSSQWKTAIEALNSVFYCAANDLNNSSVTNRREMKERWNRSTIHLRVAKCLSREFSVEAKRQEALQDIGWTTLKRIVQALTDDTHANKSSIVIVKGIPNVLPADWFCKRSPNTFLFCFLCVPSWARYVWVCVSVPFPSVRSHLLSLDEIHTAAYLHGGENTINGRASRQTETERNLCYLFLRQI